MPANYVFWRLMLFYTHLLLLLQPSVLWFPIVSFNNDAQMQNHRQGEFCANLMHHESDPGLAGFPTLNVYMAKFTPAERVTRSGRPGYPPWWVTPPIM